MTTSLPNSWRYSVADLGGEHHGFGVVAVDVEDRGLDHQRHVGRIGRRAAVLRAGGEADLVVDDEVDGPAGASSRAGRTGAKHSATTPWPAKAASPCSSSGSTWPRPGGRRGRAG